MKATQFLGTAVAMAGSSIGLYIAFKKGSGFGGLWAGMLIGGIGGAIAGAGIMALGNKPTEIVD